MEEGVGRKGFITRKKWKQKILLKLVMSGKQTQLWQFFERISGLIANLYGMLGKFR